MNNIKSNREFVHIVTSIIGPVTGRQCTRHLIKPLSRTCTPQTHKAPRSEGTSTQRTRSLAYVHSLPHLPFPTPLQA